MIEDDDDIDATEALPPMSLADKAEFGMTGKPPADEERKGHHRGVIDRIVVEREAVKVNPTVSE